MSTCFKVSRSSELVSLDPVIHGVQRHDLGALADLLHYVALQIGRDIWPEKRIRIFGSSPAAWV